ncbi:MAG: hypothetical protein Q8K61_10640 [Gallionella sp.]|nr:hypothetical protein [Gallionella sp.]
MAALKHSHIFYEKTATTIAVIRVEMILLKTPYIYRYLFQVSKTSNNPRKLWRTKKSAGVRAAPVFGGFLFPKKIMSPSKVLLVRNARKFFDSLALCNTAEKSVLQKGGKRHNQRV